MNTSNEINQLAGDETGTAINLTMKQLNDTRMAIDEKEARPATVAMATCVTDEKTRAKKLTTNVSITSKSISKKNPSIGEISIGAFTASFSASGSNLFTDVNSMQNNYLMLSGELHGEADEDDDLEEEEADNDGNSERVMLGNSKCKKAVKTNASYTSDYENTSTKVNEPDRESASNRGLAGGSINSTYMNSGGVKHANETLSIETHVSTNRGGHTTAKNVKQNDVADVKSTYTLSSCNEKPALTSVHDHDTYSLSMLSEKSINPSVTALAGSIK